MDPDFTKTIRAALTQAKDTASFRREIAAEERRSAALAFAEEADATLTQAANASTLLLTYRRRPWSNGKSEILSLVLKQPDDQPTGLYFLIDPVSGKSQWQMTHGREEHGGAWQRFEPSLLEDGPAFVKAKVLALVSQLR